MSPCRSTETLDPPEKIIECERHLNSMGRLVPRPAARWQLPSGMASSPVREKKNFLGIIRVIPVAEDVNYHGEEEGVVFTIKV